MGKGGGVEEGVVEWEKGEGKKEREEKGGGRGKGR